MALTSGDADRHLQRLAALVTQRRVTLGFASKEAAAEACGISHTTYRKIEGTQDLRPQRVRDTTYAKLEVGFKMRPGSCRAVLEGADSITLQDGTEVIKGGQIRDYVDPARLAEATPQALTKSAGLYAPELTLQQVNAINEGFMEELRRLGILPKSA